METYTIIILNHANEKLAEFQQSFPNDTLVYTIPTSMTYFRGDDGQNIMMLVTQGLPAGALIHPAKMYRYDATNVVGAPITLDESWLPLSQLHLPDRRLVIKYDAYLNPALHLHLPPIGGRRRTQKKIRKTKRKTKRKIRRKTRRYIGGKSSNRILRKFRKTRRRRRK